MIGKSLEEGMMRVGRKVTVENGKVPANAVIGGIVLIIGGIAALYAGYLIAGNLDAQFTNLATSQNLSTTYQSGIANVRTLSVGALGLIGVSLFIIGASIVIKAVRVMGE